MILNEMERRRKSECGTAVHEFQLSLACSSSITLHLMSVRGLDCGPEAAAFLDGLLGSPGHRLIYLPERGLFRRQVKQSTKKYLPWQTIAKDNDEVGAL
jgi:hypothetical protein